MQQHSRLPLEKTNFQVLDHGYVKLIDCMGYDEDIIEAARMSTGKSFVDWEHDEKLLNYLWRKKHSSPFEFCELVLEIQAPILVFRQWHRHRTQSYSEASGRYTQMPDLHYLPNPTRIKRQCKKNNQGSDGELSPTYRLELLNTYAGEQSIVYENYRNAVEKGVSKEVARLNTPVSRYSKMRAKGNLSNWLKFLNLRLRPNAQEEIREYANVIGYEIIAKLWPKTWQLFLEYDLFGAKFSRTELEILRKLLQNVSLKNEAEIKKLATEELQQEFLHKLTRSSTEISDI